MKESATVNLLIMVLMEKHNNASLFAEVRLFAD